MVLFKHEYFSMNDYWKLDSGSRGKTKETLFRILAVRNPSLKGKSSRSIGRLRELYVRHQRGMLSYEGIPARELGSFITQRGIVSTANSKTTIAELRAQLEQADNDMTFGRFSDLPPEIRQQIFKQYFDSFYDCSDWDSPLGSQPPITLASRQTRQEALPLFFSRCQSSFTAATLGCKDYDYPKLRDFMMNTSTENFTRIRYLCLSFTPVRRQHGKYTIYTINIAIDINDHACPAKVSRSSHFLGSGCGKPPEDILGKMDELLKLKPRTFIRDIAAREGRMKLRKNDFFLLSDSLWGAVNGALGID